jgi:hypothetical protein
VPGCKEGSQHPVNIACTTVYALDGTLADAQQPGQIALAGPVLFKRAE